MNKFNFFILVTSLAITGFGQTSSKKVQTMANFFVSSYNAKEYGKISEKLNEQMQEAISSDAFRKFLEDIDKDLGKITKLGVPDFANPMMATFLVEFERGKMDMILAVDAEEKIAGIRLSPPRPKTTARNKVKLFLPFKDEWLVFWGGDKVTQNYHQDHANQRFAFDILKVDENGKTHKGDGTKNEDYYAFGQEIVAPADGVVTDVVDGVRDNLPGELNPLMALGNNVMIRHKTGEVSAFAHFKLNSIRVKVGDKVKAGQTIGLCGNSGNSSEAHLHYQLQKTSKFENEGSIRVFFEALNVRENKKTEIKQNYSPIKGDIVSPK